MKILQFVTESLGDNSYLLVAGEIAAAVDPQRDIREYMRAAREHGATITHVFETHVHNDYVSGGLELAALGAEIVAPGEGKLEFPHRPVAEGEVIEVGAARLKAVAAPGHTYEHTAFLALDANEDIHGAFTGGAVLIGSAGRSDLLGADHTERLTRMQWETGQRLAKLLPGGAEVLPTHGAGSFCSSTGAGLDRRAGMAEELTRNPVLEAGAYEVFRSLHLSNLPPIPAYYRYMAPINRKGPEVYGTPPDPAEIAPDDIDRLMAAGKVVIDARSRSSHARTHVPGSLGIEDCASFLAYVSWVLPFNAPLALIVGDAEQARRLTVDLFRIGYERVEGFMPWARWEGQERPVTSIPLMDLQKARELYREGEVKVVDVRFAYEQAATPLPRALERPVDRIVEWADSLGNEPVLLACASGQRAVMAASYLKARGIDATVLENRSAPELADS